MKPETAFRQGKVIPFLRKLKNTAHFPIQQIAICGTPDFFLCSNGAFIALELKAGKGVLSKLQAYQMDRILSTGGIAIVASPENWEEIKQQLSDMDEGKQYDKDDIQANR